MSHYFIDIIQRLQNQQSCPLLVTFFELSLFRVVRPTLSVQRHKEQLDPSSPVQLFWQVLEPKLFIRVASPLFRPEPMLGSVSRHRQRRSHWQLGHETRADVNVAQGHDGLKWGPNLKINIIFYWDWSIMSIKSDHSVNYGRMFEIVTMCG